MVDKTNISRGESVIGWSLSQPSGYRVLDLGHAYVLCRPDGTEAERFDPSTAWDCEITLAAFEDHAERLMSPQ